MIILVVIGALVAGTSLNSCKTAAVISSKSGAQIWGETCIRCHNPADPATFSDLEWDVVAMHMQVRANLTPEETKKVIEFLQSAN
ncbi:MAG: hypothetical protein CL840_18745 [Crocinitomicaceae bacterium]|nr:hypothetical protein [Crocinitomicaceae bacterium]